MPDQALVERLPVNDFVELYENRIGITFEVDPSYTVMKQVTPAVNYLSLMCNVLFLAAFLIAVGSVFVT